MPHLSCNWEEHAAYYTYKGASLQASESPASDGAVLGVDKVNSLGERRRTGALQRAELSGERGCTRAPWQALTHSESREVRAPGDEGSSNVCLPRVGEVFVKACLFFLFRLVYQCAYKGVKRRPRWGA